jgi:alpha-beta hydrolase superfamily lysophospholipase
MHTEVFRLVTGDGPTIFVRRWSPETRPRAAVLIAHGAAEHSARYERVASVLTQAGYVVFAPDHRGHGQTAGSLERAGDAGSDGFNGMIRDLRRLAETIRNDYTSNLVLFGHSMGAALSQRFIQLLGGLLRGVILSGSPGLRPNLEAAAAATAKLASGPAADQISTLFQQAFASYNQGFEPIKTGFEWLSRDADEVQKYVDDPWCGFPFTNRLVAEMSQCALEAADEVNLALTPKSLPILLFSGTADRVGGNGDYVEKLATAYRRVGIADVEVKLYADGRHEMLNESNRNDVHRDVLTWLQRHL